MIKNTLTLPNGTIIANRISKSAMSENLCVDTHAPNKEIINLYSEWAKSNSGILFTGNVMVNRTCLGEPGNIVVDHESDIDLLKEWANTTKHSDSQLWVQINHPGRQAMLEIGSELVAPSAIAVNMAGRKNSTKSIPRELNQNEIIEIINSFGDTAQIIKEAGFDGVQIHGAHGYLINQFLSSNTNQRKDEWGGSFEKRTRFVLEVYKNIRTKVGKDFSVGIKLNSADFQKGGFTEEESMKVIELLSDQGIDLIEISGGTYEAPAMVGDQKESTKKREAYFLEFAAKAREITSTPLMVTGGFRTLQGMNNALASGALDIVGIARPFCIYPHLAQDLFDDKINSFHVEKRGVGIKAIDSLMNIVWYEAQIKRIANNKKPKQNLSAWLALWEFIKLIRKKRRGKA